MKAQIEKYVGKRGSIVVNNMKVNVKVLDYKEPYGKKRWLVTPLSGEGQSWTEQEPLQEKLEESNN